MELIARIDPQQTKTVVITAYATVETAVRAMKLGATDYLRKPFDLQDIVQAAERCRRRALAEGPDCGEEARPAGLVFASRRMQAVVETVRKVKDSDIPVLLRGESGTGKEMVARLIHESGKRARSPFLGINCAAIPAELLESELFGHEKGAFTGARERKSGKFEAAGEGSIFLDEIGDMAPGLQTKLLRTLEERAFEPVGSNRPVELKARIIASTNCDLQALIEERRFRPDLYFRLKGITITLPPLRERPEDIERLVEHFLERCRARYRKPGVELARETLRHLKGYHWPGNVRELKNAVESAVLLSDQDRPLLPGDFPLESGPAGGPGRRAAEIERLERETILEALKRHRFNRSIAAKELGMSRKTLYNKLRKYALT